MALKDPLRADLKDTLGYAPLSGIELRLISGDNLNTAKAVAVDAGILTLAEFNKYGNDHAMDAKEFANLVGDVVEQEEENEDGQPVVTGYGLSNQDEFNRIIKDLRVIGRATSADK